MPADGNSYSGIVTYDSTYQNLNIREYLANELLSPLKVGVKYYVSFKTNLAFSLGQWGLVIATNNIGVRFTTFKANDWTNCLYASNYAHVNTQNIITDTLNWTTVSGTFIADSAYKYMVIGNFFDSNHTLHTCLTGFPGGAAYYYIDDVCVTTDSLNCSVLYAGISSAKTNEFLLQINRVFGQVVLHINSPPDKLNFFLFDGTGRIVLTYDYQNMQTLDIIIPNDYKGLYYYKIDLGESGIKTGKLYLD